MPDRAILFIDGNNWYHACKEVGVSNLARLDYALISRKLVGPREWLGTRYYIGALKHAHGGYKEQRQFLSRIQNADPRITPHYGRIEERPYKNELASVLAEYLATTPGIDPGLQRDLGAMAAQYQKVSILKEKAADVMLAVEMSRMAWRDEFDAAYLLSADGDFTPAVEAVREQGKKVFAVSPLPCSALKGKVNAFILVPKEWFDDCYGP